MYRQTHKRNTYKHVKHCKCYWYIAIAYGIDEFLKRLVRRPFVSRSQTASILCSEAYLLKLAPSWAGDNSQKRVNTDIVLSFVYNRQSPSDSVCSMDANTVERKIQDLKFLVHSTQRKWPRSPIQFSIMHHYERVRSAVQRHRSPQRPIIHRPH